MFGSVECVLEQMFAYDALGSTALKYFSIMHKNGKQYNIEVLYNKSNNTIYHFYINQSR